MYKIVNPIVRGAPSNCVKRLVDNAFIPFDTANTDYQAYLKWLDGYEPKDFGWIKTSDGNTPLPADEPNEGTE